MLNSPGENALTRIPDPPKSANIYNIVHHTLIQLSSVGSSQVFSNGHVGASSATAKVSVCETLTAIAEILNFQNSHFFILVFAKVLNYEHIVKTVVKTFLI